MMYVINLFEACAHGMHPATIAIMLLCDDWEKLAEAAQTLGKNSDLHCSKCFLKVTLQSWDSCTSGQWTFLCSHPCRIAESVWYRKVAPFPGLL